MCLTGRLRRPLRHVSENAWPQRRTRSIESTIGLLIFLELVDRRGRPSMAGLHYPIDARPADAERLGDCPISRRLTAACENKGRCKSGKRAGHGPPVAPPPDKDALALPFAWTL